MKNELKMEFQRSWKSKGFWIAISIGIGIAIMQFVNIVLPLRNHILAGDYPFSAFEKWLCGSDDSVFPALYYFVVPILIALPNAGSCKLDFMTGYVRNVLIRTSRKDYFVAKYIVTFLMGGFIAIFPMVFNFLLTASVLPALLPQASIGYYPIFSYHMLSDVYYTYPYLYLLVYLVINFVFFGFLATLSLLASYICDKLFTTILAPFITYLFVYGVTQLTGLHTLCPFGFLRPSQPVPTSIVVVLAEILCMCAAGGIYYYVSTKKDIY